MATLCPGKIDVVHHATGQVGIVDNRAGQIKVIEILVLEISDALMIAFFEITCCGNRLSPDRNLLIIQKELKESKYPVSGFDR